MRPVDNQQARLYRTHKFDYVNDILFGSIKFQPITDRTAFYIMQYKSFRITYFFCAKTYIPPLILNLFLNISQIDHHYKMMGKMLPMMLNRYSGNIPVLETIDYITQQI